MSERGYKPEEDKMVFQSYPSTTIIRTGALVLGIFIFIAAIILSLPFFSSNVGLAIYILLCGIIVALLLTAGSLVFMNMSDDLKLLGEEVAKLRRDTLAFHKSASSYYDASVDYMQDHLDALNELLEKKKN